MSDDTTNGTPDESGDDGPLDARAAAVSAYVDGEASDDEVRRVESDASMLADVRRLRAIRTELRQVTPLEPSLRDRLLGAALDEFDAGRAGAIGAGPGPAANAGPPPPPAPPAPARPAGHGSGRWLAVAAAVVGVVATAGLAVALVTSTGGDDDSADVLSADRSPDEAQQPGAGRDEGGSADTEDDSGDAAGATVAAEEVNDLTEDTEPTLRETGESPGTEGDMSAQPSASDGRSNADQAVDAPADIESDTELTDWVLDVEDGRITPARAGERACGRTILGSASSGGDDVVVVVDGGRVLALDTDSCDVVLATDAPD